ncbi:RNA polymerase sigma factor [Haloferula helveola]|uniref:RNA polymerase sigma factor n=2 Tax=Haloferula helveola TaxID=490095 RepID=A0ABN6HCY8_9BACT|nr:RNA polymerase sigma factor [Haloferula helveola]
MTMGDDANQDLHRLTAELLARVAHQDGDALRRLYREHGGRLLGIIQSVVRDRGEAEDVLQEAFVTIWNKAGMYDPKLGKALTWMITVARNRAFDRLRSLGRKADLKREQEGELQQRVTEQLRRQSEPSLPDDELQAIDRALNELPEEQREAITLAYLNGLTQQEIADCLDSPLGTVKARIRRGLARLKSRLSQQTFYDQA